jgi:hypothetical protein
MEQRTPAGAMARQICESIDRLEKEADKVEFWACAVTGFAQPIPDYDHWTVGPTACIRRPLSGD